MNMKNTYVEYAKKTFEGKALEIVLNQIELFYDDTIVSKRKHCLGEDVLLHKGDFMHGISGGLDHFRWIVEHGFISSYFTGVVRPNKYFHSVGMWNIQKDCLLRDYIYEYSGVTLGYCIGRGPGCIKKSKLIPYHEFEKTIEEINNDSDIWMWNAEQTKEIRFLPSLAASKIQIAFILNMDSDSVEKMKYADIFNSSMDENILKYFIVKEVLGEFLSKEKDAFTTNRESSIMFGLPIRFVEGILVGRQLESDEKSLTYIQNLLPDCYICNLDGKVIR